MACEGKRCKGRKRVLGPVVWVVDGVGMCATCFEHWIERADTVFDQHKIVRFDEKDDKAFELHKGNGNPNSMLASRAVSA